MDSFAGEFPSEILVNHIFSLLDIDVLCRIERVCKLWKSLIWTNLKSVTLGLRSEMEPKIAQNILDKAINVRSVTFLNVDRFLPVDFEEVLGKCSKQLEELTIFSPNRFKIESLSRPHEIPPRNLFPNLKILRTFGSRANESSMFYLPNTLTELDLTGSTKLDDSCLKIISKQCKNLEVIQLKGIYKITSVGLNEVIKSNVNLKEIYLPNLKHIGDSSLVAMATHTTGLRNLDIRGCFKMTANGIVDMATICTQLQHLTLKFMNELADIEIDKITQHCTKLKVLDLQGLQNITDESLVSIANNCKEFKGVDLRDCKNIKATKGMLALAQSCPQLNDIRVRSSAIFDETIDIISNNCKNLTHLDLQECVNVTKEGLLALVTGCPNLLHLNLMDFSDHSVKTVLENKSPYRYLKFP